MDHAPQVDVDHPVPVLQRDLPGVAAVHHAGVVHGDMELAEALDGRRPDALDGVRVPDVDGHGMDVCALIGEPRRLCPKVLLVDVGHDDAHPFADKSFGDRQPYAAGRAGDHGGPSLELPHWGQMVLRALADPTTEEGDVDSRAVGLQAPKMPAN